MNGSAVVPDPIHWRVRWINEQVMRVIRPDIDNMTLTGIIVREGGSILEDPDGEMYQKAAAREVEPIHESVVAVLVYKGGPEGCVRVVGERVQNTITGQGDDDRRLLVLIKPGEKGWIYGQPQVRLYKRVRPEASFQNGTARAES